MDYFLLCRPFHRQLLTALLLLITISSSAQIGWVKVATPDTSTTRNILRGITGTSSTDIWTVGIFQEVNTAPPYYIQKDLISHWNGSNWQIFPPVTLSTNLDELWDVDALSSNNVWAVGDYNDIATQAKLLHYNGSTWSNVSVPKITGGSFFYSVEAINENNIWAVGGKHGSPVSPAYTLHYNGTAWIDVPVPTIGTYWNAFNKVNGQTANDVWAAGYWGNHYGDFHALVMHWNGTAWQNTTLPANIVSEGGQVLDIESIAANDVWATGYFETGGFYKIHWNGSSWTEVTPPNGGGGAFASLATNNVFSVGNEISHWDGSKWTITDTLANVYFPSLISTVHFSNGEVWAAGRQMDSTGTNFFTLVYRSINNLPSFDSAGLQTVSVSPGEPTSLNVALKVHDEDVAQVVSYSVISTPAHGTLQGFPTSAITSGGYAQPVNTTYTPEVGFNGTDQFIIRVSIGDISTSTTINAKVGSTLPVVLNSFIAIKNKSNIQLQWSTGAEVNSSDFELEKSVDGISYTTLTKINSVGNSTSVTNYSFTDVSPVQGSNYYRLKLLNKDGTVTYFSQKVVQWNSPVASTIFSILANPITSDKVNIYIQHPGRYFVTIYNNSGGALLQKSVTASSNYMNIDLPQQLPAGTYFISVQSNNTVESKMFIKPK